MIECGINRRIYALDSTRVKLRSGMVDCRRLGPLASCVSLSVLITHLTNVTHD